MKSFVPAWSRLSTRRFTHNRIISSGDLDDIVAREHYDFARTHLARASVTFVDSTRWTTTSTSYTTTNSSGGYNLDDRSLVLRMDRPEVDTDTFEDDPIGTSTGYRCIELVADGQNVDIELKIVRQDDGTQNETVVDTVTLSCGSSRETVRGFYLLSVELDDTLAETIRVDVRGKVPSSGTAGIYAVSAEEARYSHAGQYLESIVLEGSEWLGDWADGATMLVWDSDISPLDASGTVTAQVDELAKFASAVQLSGSAYLETQGNVTIGGATEFCLSFSLRVDNTGGSFSGDILEVVDGAGTTAAVSIYITSGSFRFVFTDTSPTAQAAIGAWPTDNAWHDVVAIYDGTSLSVWLDGEVLTSGALVGKTVSQPTPGVGRIGSNLVYTTGSDLVGYISSVYLLNTSFNRGELLRWLASRRSWLGASNYADWIAG